MTQHFYASDRAISESGFDLSQRFGQVGQLATHYAPISLNVLLYQMGNDLNTIAQLSGSPMPVKTKTLKQQAAFINTFFVNKESQYRDRLVEPLAIPLPRFSYFYAANFYPLWSAKLASPLSVQAMINEGLKTQQINGQAVSLLPRAQSTQFGIPSSLNASGMQWDYPYAWAPLQYFINQGLINHQQYQLSHRVMQNWLNAGDIFFSQTGDFIEKYVSHDPLSDQRVKLGYAQAQKGFGWTNAVYMQFYNQLH